ncbi:MAG: large-conductance mechanosensitive channel protein MscL [Chloroflexota bacterium]
MLKEFKEFTMRGSVIDLAVGVIIGGAFGKIVSSLVNDIIMPPIGMLLNGVNFSDLYFPLDGMVYPSLAEAQAAGAPTLNYGLFINNIIDFLLIAFVIFLMIRTINRMKKQPEPVSEPTSKDCPFCFTSIPVQATRCPHCTSQLK